MEEIESSDASDGGLQHNRRNAPKRKNLGASTSSDTSTSFEVPPKRPRNTKKDVIDTFWKDMENFALQVTKIRSAVTKRGGEEEKEEEEEEEREENYRRLYRLYKSALKAQATLEKERNDLQFELEMPSLAVKTFKTRDKDTRVWSDCFYKSPKTSKAKTVKKPSPTTTQIGSLLHSIGSLYGLTAEAVCSNKQKPENEANMRHLLAVVNAAIEQLGVENQLMSNALQPYISKKKAANTSD